ncbi:unnamed protein product [Strongylus vulgaris]|uniref:Uncharacterized protein n=1 Tax=Strongylus vulgaris TaxID=40348 RepID=A0A3P7KPW1_STRVU|nr:unnamed protein product [Strongylus vulgaris]
MKLTRVRTALNSATVDRLIRRGWSEEKALRQAFHDTNEQMLGELSAHGLLVGRFLQDQALLHVSSFYVTADCGQQIVVIPPAF